MQEAPVSKHKSFLLLFFKKEVLFFLFCGLATATATPPDSFDVVIRHGEVYDGSGAAPVLEDVGVSGDRIAAIAPHLAGRGKTEIDAHGKAVAPGFINMLAHPEVTLPCL